MSTTKWKIEQKCNNCLHFKHTEEKFDGYEDMGFIKIPKMKTIPAHCSLGNNMTICNHFLPNTDGAELDGMNNILDQILNEVTKQKGGE